MNLEQRIQVLDDRDAVRILTSFAQHQPVSTPRR